MKIKIPFLDVKEFARHFYRDDRYIELFNRFFEEYIKNSPGDIYWFKEGELPGQVLEGFMVVEENENEGHVTRLILEKWWGE